MSLGSEIISNVNTIATTIDSYKELTNDAVEFLQDTIESVQERTNFISYSQLREPTPIEPEDAGTPPNDYDYFLDQIKAFLFQSNLLPAQPNLTPIPSITSKTFESAGTAPTLDFGNLPGEFTDTVPNAPTVNEVTIPDFDGIPTYEAPTIEDVVLPARPDFMALPTFDGQKPADLVEPALQPLSFTEQDFVSEIKDAAEAWLMDKLTNGGTGLHPDVEAAIWNRALTREVISARENIEEAADEFAASGFPRPSGSLRARLDTIRADLQRKTEDLSRKIAEDQAKLAQENTIVALKESLSHAAQQMQFHNAVMDRLLSYGKALVDTSVGIYNLKVAEYQAKWDGYKAEASVFAEIVRASFAEVERYKAELEASMAVIEVDKAKIDRYKAQIEGAELLVRVYNSEIEGAKAKAQIEAIKLEQYKNEVDGYAAKARIKELEFRAYEARVRGESTKVDAFRAEVESIKLKNEALRAQTENEKITAENILADNTHKLEVYKMNHDIIKTQIAHNAQAITAAMSVREGDVSVYRSRIENARTQNEINKTNAELTLEAAKTNVLSLNETYRLQAQLITEKAKAAISGAADALDSLTGVVSAVASQVSTIQQLVSNEEYEG